jgi:hypothetical protein
VVESGDELGDVDDAVVTRAGRDGLLRTIDVNSFQALEDTTKPVSSLSIVIVVERDDVLPGFEIVGQSMDLGDQEKPGAANGADKRS